MKVVGYARVSTSKQRDEATIETQVSLIETFCKQKGHDLIRVYRDDGISATVTLLQDRPEGKQLLEDANAGTFQAVIVYKADRLGRSSLVMESAADELYDKRGIDIIGIAEHIDLSTTMGRMMFTIGGAIAAVERNNTLKRSMDATLRYAEQGVWLGGIVPYGYRIDGKKKEARLVLSTESIPGFDFSEVDVVRMIYRWAADEGRSCLVIAERLHEMGVPTSYYRDGREVLSNKRKRKTANLWSCGRVRNMIVETTYKGVHLWGKRQKPTRPNQLPRPHIERAVPPIVDEDTWQRAQQTLTKNQRLSYRNSKRRYLLRGKIKCGLCNLTYCGSVSRGARVDASSVNREHATYEVKDGFYMRPYYCCNGKMNFRGLFGQNRQRCPSRMISAQLVEDAVWTDIEVFLRNPSDVLEEIQKMLAEQGDGAQQLQDDLRAIENRLTEVQRHKDKMFDLFRREIINDEALVAQLKIVDDGKEGLDRQKQHLQKELAKLANQQQNCHTAQQLLWRLNTALSGELTFEVKQEIIEALVDRIVVDTLIEGKKKIPKVSVYYRFEQPTTHRITSTLTVTDEDVRAVICLAE